MVLNLFTFFHFFGEDILKTLSETVFEGPAFQHFAGAYWVFHTPVLGFFGRNNNLK